MIYGKMTKYYLAAIADKHQFRIKGRNDGLRLTSWVVKDIINSRLRLIFMNFLSTWIIKAAENS